MIKNVLIIYLIWLVAINAFAFYSLNRLNLNPDTAYSWINPKEFSQDKSLDLINLRVHWDSFWYLKIVSSGYEYIPQEMSSIAFFPLYPMLIWLISLNQILSPIFIGWIISTCSLGIGLIYLYKLVAKFHPTIKPLNTIINLLLFPTAFFLNSVYTESVFLAISIAVFYYLFKRNFLLAALLIALASITRINGLFLLTPFIVEYLHAYGWKKFVNINLLTIPLSLTGIGGFMVYQYLQFGEPLAFIKAQMEWGRKFTLNSEHLQLITPAANANFASDLGFFALALICGIALLRIRLSYGAYVLTTILIAVSTGTLMSITRFSLILFPIFILITSIKNEQFQFGWRLISTLLLTIFTTLFVNNYWAG